MAKKTTKAAVRKTAKPAASKTPPSAQMVRVLRRELAQKNSEIAKIRGQYEAAQTYPTNENHWSKADHLSPDAANDPMVRATLRARSRFEIVENNPYLNGALISICNDFAGSEIRMRITDMTIPEKIRKRIEMQWYRWQKSVKLRKILWQLRMDKIVAGEGFAVQFHDRRLAHPVHLNYRVIEADCVTDPISEVSENGTFGPENADGIRLDAYGIPESYHVLNHHPGGSGALASLSPTGGKWIPAEQMIHVFRPMRGWHRGIPELTPSIPLCAVARRYTMALVRCAEIQASMAAVLESDIPNYRNLMTPPTETVDVYDEDGNVIGQETRQVDDPGPMFDFFGVDKTEINMGGFHLLPQGMKFKTWDRVPVGQQYDQFIGALMREIFRPLLIPYNLGIGSSKDSNMAAGVLDAHLYTKGQLAERTVFEEDVLEPMFRAWFEEGLVTEGYFKQAGYLPEKYSGMPDHIFGWDDVTVEHTDPQKIAGALERYLASGVYTFKHVVEEKIGQDYEEWKDLKRQEAAFIKELRELSGEDPVRTSDTGTNNDESEEDKE